MRTPTYSNWMFTKNNPESNFTLSLTTLIKYYVYQKEQGTTPHIQGYIVLHKRISLHTMRETLPGCHLEPRKGTHAQAKKYCTKIETRIDGPWEDGIEPQQGKRTDLVRGLELTIQGAPIQDIVDEIGCTAIRYRRHLIEVASEAITEQNNKRMKLDFQEAVLRDWQKILWDKLLEEPNDRHILWYTDETGNQGKTWFSKYLVAVSGAAYYTNGKSGDIKFAYKGERIVVFDLCRSTEERVNYEILETIKNGILFNTKYQSTTRIFKIPHVVVFANFGPDRSKLSEDRWKITNLINFI